MRFNGVFSRNNLSKIKHGVYITNFDVYESIGTHCIALYVNDNNVTYFDSFGVEHIQKKFLKIIGSKNIVTNIYRVKTLNLIMCGYFCIGFIDFKLKCKSLLDYTNLLSPNDYKKNDKIILKYFQLLKRWKNYIVLFAVIIENLKNLKYHTF